MMTPEWRISPSWKNQTWLKHVSRLRYRIAPQEELKSRKKCFKKQKSFFYFNTFFNVLKLKMVLNWLREPILNICFKKSCWGWANVCLCTMYPNLKTRKNCKCHAWKHLSGSLPVFLTVPDLNAIATILSHCFTKEPFINDVTHTGG